MDFNNKEKVDDILARGFERYRDDRELLDFLEAYHLSMLQRNDVRLKNKDELNFTMTKLYGIIELRELLISDRKVEEPTEEPDMEGKSVESLLSKVKSYF